MPELLSCGLVILVVCYIVSRIMGHFTTTGRVDSILSGFVMGIYVGLILTLLGTAVWIGGLWVAAGQHPLFLIPVGIVLAVIGDLLRRRGPFAWVIEWELLHLYGGAEVLGVIIVLVGIFTFLVR